MFFVPTITNLRQTNKLYLLCLSNGNFAGLGKVREKELEASCRRLGFAETPSCVDDVSLQDGMASVWTEEAVADQILRFIRAHPDLEFQTIVTFDENGVSSHPNHISTFKGVLHFLSKKQTSVYRVLSLKTVNIVRKYISYADITNLELKDFNFITFDPRESFASLSLHWSQFVWFRKLFIMFSSYTFANSLVEYKTS